MQDLLVCVYQDYENIEPICIVNHSYVEQIKVCGFDFSSQLWQDAEYMHMVYTSFIKNIFLSNSLY